MFTGLNIRGNPITDSGVFEMVKALSTNSQCNIECIVLPTGISTSAQEAVYKFTSAAINNRDRLKYFPVAISELIIKWIQFQQSKLMHKQILIFS